MPAQPSLFPPGVAPSGALILTEPTLNWNDLLAIYSRTVSAQVTLAQLQLFFGTRPVVSLRVEDSGQTLDMDDGSNYLVVDTGAGGNTTVNLPTSPADGEVCMVKDGGGQLDIGGQSITLQSADGNINGQATLVMQAAWQVVNLTYSEDLGIWLTT